MDPHTRTPALLTRIRDTVTGAGELPGEIHLRVRPHGEYVLATTHVGLEFASGSGDTIAAALQSLLDDVETLVMRGGRR